MYSPKLIICSLLGVAPFSGSIPLLLSTISSTNKLNETSPHWNKLIQVKFYGKDNKDTSIKVWIEDLENINRAEYLDNNA
ncbi:hypothetical protein A6V39_04085 [Candidatus Mycoplasma haematobovis]|uniref:Uncharacterized protein n=1 Tax=Candidatus Mycoplasma haematobovis TaxID=432608 RepID=A0A1A9QCV9_9MOLU|nr:hypothetical protein [Candidatus Mycoplasma haematobovis]OAL10068.1 hypothetical protein A6V39_04085 [Candidatus Mycoplasma haematobovis]